MNYLITQRFRLVDTNQYLDAGEVFRPDDNYARTSRSLAAALRAGWARKISDEEADKAEAKLDASRAKKFEAAEKEGASKIKAPVGTGVEMQPEDLADEVVGEGLVEARDARREQQEEQAKAAAAKTDDSSEEAVTEVAAKLAKKTAKKDGTAAKIKKEIETKAKAKRKTKIRRVRKKKTES